MDVVVLPLVWSHTTVSEALDLLQQHKRSGVVCHGTDDRYQLIYAGDLLRARARAASTIALVGERHPVLLVDEQRARPFGVDAIRPRRTPLQYEHLFDASKVQYGLVGEAADVVLIVTRHEGQTQTLTSTGGYECNGSPTHYFPEPRVTVGQVCPQYPLCSTVDGSKPTIRPAL